MCISQIVTGYISEDMRILSQKYCIIFGTALQSRTFVLFWLLLLYNYIKEMIPCLKKSNAALFTFVYPHQSSSYMENHLRLKKIISLLMQKEKFEPTRNIAYKRGNIVKIQFGFNIGSEYGGLHYGVVLDNKNAHNSPVVTVIPLTSARENRTLHSNSVNLGNDIYRLLKLKYDTIDKALKEEQQEIEETLSLFDSMLALSRKSVEELEQCDKESDEFDQKLLIAKGHLETAKKLQAIWEEKSQHNKEQQDYLEKIGLEISRMKEGSVALVNQITTISKMRIFDPRNLKGVLAGISLSEDNMKKINQKVQDLYIF